MHNTTDRPTTANPHRPHHEQRKRGYSLRLRLPRESYPHIFTLLTSKPILCQSS